MAQRRPFRIVAGIVSTHRCADACVSHELFRFDFSRPNLNRDVSFEWLKLFRFRCAGFASRSGFCTRYLKFWRIVGNSFYVVAARFLLFHAVTQSSLAPWHRKASD
jgi:hypothetical protein